MQNKKQKFKKNAGFTLIEVMISMTIFSVIVTIGISAVVTALAQHKSAENMRNVMDNLNFVLEDMARNIRLGQNFHCVVSNEAVDDTSVSTSPVIPNDCPSGAYKLVFNGFDGHHISYQFIVPTLSTDPVKITKQKDDNVADIEDITPSEIYIDGVHSGFTVRGTQSFSSGDYAQPTVVIRIKGKVVYKNTSSDFAIETEVTPRSLDSQ